MHGPLQSRSELRAANDLEGLLALGFEPVDFNVRLRRQEAWLPWLAGPLKRAKIRIRAAGARLSQGMSLAATLAALSWACSTRARQAAALRSAVRTCGSVGSVLKGYSRVPKHLRVGRVGT